MPITQPTFPSPVSGPSDAELNFIEESPPGLFPENPESIIGLFRTLISNRVQTGADQLLTIYTEKFVATSQVYLDEWETMLGLPTDPSIDTAHRRARILGRVRQGSYTREARNAVIEYFIGAVFGDLITFTPGGVPLLGGVPIYAHSSDIKKLYRVYENLLPYKYEVWIDNTVTPDMNGLTRELKRLDPAGISEIVLADGTTYSGTNLIDWQRTVIDLASSGWWWLGNDYNDYSGLAQNGTVTGTPALDAALVTSNHDPTNAARLFDGTSNHVTITGTDQLHNEIHSIHVIVKPSSIPGTDRCIYSVGTQTMYLSLSSTGKFIYGVFDGTSIKIAVSTTTAVVGTTYNIVGKCDGKEISIWINGVRENAANLVALPQLSGNIQIAANGSSAFRFPGTIDEVIFLGYELKDDRILYLYKQARNIL